jgi:septal ring factor EnvC (AmiA/AmiB activator)
MSEKIIDMAKTIAAQEKVITGLKADLERSESERNKYVSRSCELEDRVRKLKKEFGEDPGTVVMLQESHAMLKKANDKLTAENQSLHARTDKAFGAVQMDAAAKKRYFQASIDAVK